VDAEQPRKRFDEASLNSLADSIRERGVLQPIIVQPHTGGGYQLIAGERRWRASKIAARPTIPALVDDAVDGTVSLELALDRSDGFAWLHRDGLKWPRFAMVDAVSGYCLMIGLEGKVAAVVAERAGGERSGGVLGMTFEIGGGSPVPGP